jgi:hypothetical protein
MFFLCSETPYLVTDQNRTVHVLNMQFADDQALLYGQWMLEQGWHIRVDIFMGVDNNNILHIILGNRLGDCGNGIWHGVWQGERRSEFKPLVSGPKTTQFEPTAPVAAISQRKLLLATWEHESAEQNSDVLYLYATLNAPGSPTVVPPTSIPTVSPTPARRGVETSIQSKPTSRPIPAMIAHNSTPNTVFMANNPGIPLLLGMAPVVLLIVGVIVVYCLFLRIR